MIGCLICDGFPIETHHIYTRKARPDLIHVKWNLFSPICRKHHTLWHSKGTKSMAQSYQVVEAWLIDNGWELINMAGRWKWFRQ